MSEQKNLKPIPKFSSEDEEREFWANHDSTDHVSWQKAKPVTFSLAVALTEPEPDAVTFTFPVAHPAPAARLQGPGPHRAGAHRQRPDCA